jgi:hypothetical protein
LRFFYEHAATGDKDHGCDKAKDSKKVPVHALGYILIVFEVIILSAPINSLMVQSMKFHKTGNLSFAPVFLMVPDYIPYFAGKKLS